VVTLRRGVLLLLLMQVLLTGPAHVVVASSGHKPPPPPTPARNDDKPPAPDTPTPAPAEPAVAPSAVPPVAHPTATPPPTSTPTPLPTSIPSPTTTPRPTHTPTSAPTLTSTPTPTASGMAAETVGGLAAGAMFLVTLPLLGTATVVALMSVARAIRGFERTYRRQTSLELERLQARAVEVRRRELSAVLSNPDGWRRVLDQLLAEALDTTARVGREGVLDVSTAPTPRFTVAGEDGRLLVFTSSPGALRRVGLLGRKEQAISLDAALHPAARVEVQAVWEHLATRWLRGSAPVLPRQAEWFLVVREQPAPGRGRSGARPA
jgi:hypothetical protein